MGASGFFSLRYQRVGVTVDTYLDMIRSDLVLSTDNL